MEQDTDMQYVDMLTQMHSVCMLMAKHNIDLATFLQLPREVQLALIEKNSPVPLPLPSGVSTFDLSSLNRLNDSLKNAGLSGLNGWVAEGLRGGFIVAAPLTPDQGPIVQPDSFDPYDTINS